MQTSMNEEHLSSEFTQKIIRDFDNHLKLSDEDDRENDQESHEERDYEDDPDEQEDFSFSFDAVNFSTISADDAFDNGQIKPVFPLFNRDLLLGDVKDLESLRLKDRLPQVKNVFVEAREDDHDLNATTSSRTADEENIVGPYCEWSKKVVEAAPEGCKKSNSTGFSKIWRFKDFMHRSNSDGRDAFVFLNNTPAPPSTSASTAAPVRVKREDKVAEGGPLKKVNKKGDAGGKVVKVKKVQKNKTATLTPHEIYMRSKAKDADRRRSYLPHRPVVVGLFTNVNGGGLTRNVHPY